MSMGRKLIGATKCVIGVTHACLFITCKTLTAPYTILVKGEGKLLNTKDNIDTIKFWLSEGVNDIKEK